MVYKEVDFDKVKPHNIDKLISGLVPMGVFKDTQVYYIETSATKGIFAFTCNTCENTKEVPWLVNLISR